MDNCLLSLFDALTLCGSVAIVLCGGCDKVQKDLDLPRTVSFHVADAVIVAPDAFFGKDVSGSVVRWGGGAAADLTNALVHVTGKDVRLYSESRVPANVGKVIYLGDVQAARDAGIARDDLPNLAYRIVVRGDAAYLWSKTATGASYAVTEFLDRFCGCRLVGIVPEPSFRLQPDLSIKSCDCTSSPAIYARSAYAGSGPKTVGPLARKALDGDRSGYLRRIRLHYRVEDIEREECVSAQIRNCHSQFDYVPPERYFKEHPEFYSMKEDGLRHGLRNTGAQLCFSNTNVFEIAYESLMEAIRKDRRQNPNDSPCIYDFTQMDCGDSLCLCPECIRTIAKYNRKPDGHAEGGDMGLQLEFANRLIRKVNETYPDVKIRVFAYVSTEIPPLHIVPDDHVIVWLCDLYTQCDHMIPLSHPHNAQRRQLIEDWRKITDKIEIWDYMLYSRSYSRGRMWPEVNVDAIASDAKFFRRLGINRLFMESAYDVQPFYELNTYVMARCYWDPGCDLERVIDDFCTVYGKGSEKMREAIDIIRRKTLAEPARTVGDFFARTLPWCTRETLDAVRTHVLEAYGKAEGRLERAMIAKVLANLDERLSELRGGTAEELALAKRDQEDSVRFRMETLRFECRNEADYERLRNEYLDDLERERELKALKFSDMPANLKDRADGVFCIDFRRWRGQKVAKVVDDPDSETGKAVEFSAGKTSALPLQMGLHDWTTKESAYFSFLGEGLSEKYAWFRMGVGHVGRNTKFWHADWWGLTDVSSVFVSCDGAPKDLNWFEVWASLRKKNGHVMFDRLVLSRTDPPKKDKERQP